MTDLERMGAAAKAASRVLAMADTEAKNRALDAIAQALNRQGDRWLAANREDLEAALSACVTFTHRQADTLSWSEYLDLGLNGNRKKREAVCRLLHMGPCNAKTCFRRMNLLGITKEEAERLVQDAGSDCDGPAD